MTTADALVVGAGIWGCTVARLLAAHGKRVRVIEKRPVVGGNCRCETDPETGIEVHTYGSHIFHTSDARVWHFLNQFTTFNGYNHKVLARHKGHTYFLPLGLTLINQFYGVDLQPEEVPAFIAAKVGDAPETPRNFEEQAIRFIGPDLYAAFIKEYTRKQWNRDPKELPAEIIRRLPVRASYDINYFNDPYQGIPSDGYNALFERMLTHANIEVCLNEEFTLPEEMTIPVYSSAPIDALFGYKFGELTWRSLRFETEKLPLADFQGTSVVNYVDADVAWTRIHEFKHYHPEDFTAMQAPTTIISREYPADWKKGDEPYYPLETAETTAKLAQYRAEAAKYPKLVVGGRLGAFKYYDMDKAVAAAFAAVYEEDGVK